MRKRLIILSLVATLSAYAQNRHVVLISIDGLRPDMYLDSSWPAPNLRALMKRGMYSQHVLSVFPAYTYPAHTAMLTGKPPAESGVTHNVKDDAGNWFWFLENIHAKTLWQAAREKGLTTGAVQWPVSVGSGITYNIPEIWDVKRPGDRITETRKYATPGLIEEIELQATGKLDSVNMNEEHFSFDENAARMAGYIFKKYAPNFLAIHFACVDGMEHTYGREHDSVRLALANADHAVGIILEAIAQSNYRDSTTIIVVGDHGFSDIHTVIRPNVLLQGMNVKFKSSGGSAFLYGDVTERNKVVKRLNALPDSVKQLFRIMDRKELDELGADGNALLALSGALSVVFSAAVPSSVGPGTTINASSVGFISKTKGGHHGYDPRMPEMWTGFIAAGAGIKKGKTIPEMKLTDIAGMIAGLLHVTL